MKSLVALALCIGLASTAYSQNWPSFRGQNSAGVGDGNSLPAAWNAEKSISVLWKTPIPGLGHSSPVVWGDRVFVTTAVSGAANSEFVHGPTQTPASADDNSKHSFRVYCLNKNSGRIIWEKAIYEGVPKVKRHVKASYANPTPVTDGKKLVVSFGSEGLYCFDLEGKLLWKQDLGVLDGGWSSGPDFHWGFGSSPIIYKVPQMSHTRFMPCVPESKEKLSPPKRTLKASPGKALRLDHTWLRRLSMVIIYTRALTAVS